MINMYDIKKYSEKHPECWYEIKESKNENGEIHEEVYDRESGKYVCDGKTFLRLYREKAHCDFEEIWYCHGVLTWIIRCRECGTVIFGSDDEHYDPNLCCPTCGNYDCHFEYWTKEEIENDEKKKKAIEWYEKDTARKEMIYKSEKERGLRNDIWKKWKIEKKNKHYEIILKVDDYLFNRLKGLHLEISKWVKCEDSSGFIWKTKVAIPLSWSYLILTIRIKLLRFKRKLKGEPIYD